MAGGSFGQRPSAGTIKAGLDAIDALATLLGNPDLLREIREENNRTFEAAKVAGVTGTLEEAKAYAQNVIDEADRKAVRASEEIGKAKADFDEEKRKFGGWKHDEQIKLKKAQDEIDSQRRELAARMDSVESAKAANVVQKADLDKRAQELSERERAVKAHEERIRKALGQ